MTSCPDLDAGTCGTMGGPGAVGAARDLPEPGWRSEMPDRTCSIDECTRPVIARSWCGAHYARWQRHGHPTGGGPDRTDRGICSIDGCDRPHECRGWCALHYKRWLAHGDPLFTKQIHGDDEARFWSNVDQTPSNGCWLWTGNRDRQDYGLFTVDGQKVRAHRFAYELLVGEIPEGLVLDHVVCDTPPCVNPAHLDPTTSVANVMRSPRALAAINARKTHCVHGHEFTPENTYRTATGGRLCRTCSLRRSAAYYRKRKSK